MSLREALLKQELPENIRFRLERVLKDDSMIEELQLYTYLMNEEIGNLSKFAGLTLVETDVFVEHFHTMRKSEIESKKLSDEIMTTIVTPLIDKQDIKAISLLKSLTEYGESECYLIKKELQEIYWEWRKKDEENGSPNKESFCFDFYHVETDKERASILGLCIKQYKELIEALGTIQKLWNIQYSDTRSFDQEFIEPNIEKENYYALSNIYRGVPRPSQYSLFKVLHEKGFL